MELKYSVIALFNHKGGVSKTTTTYNLGWSLAAKGKRVLMIDCDSQCNLTGMTLSLARESDFDKLYERNRKANLYGALKPAFDASPEAIEGVECFEVPGRDGLYLLPGHVNVAEYDVPLGVAQNMTGSLGVTRNLPGAFGRLVRATAERLNVDIVLVDMSPSISALNQNIFISSTHFVVPSSPDYFCSLAIDSLAKVLPKWADWPGSARDSGEFEGAYYPLPERPPVFLGTILQKFRPRYGAPTKAFQHWIDQINGKVAKTLVPVLRKHNMMLPDAAYQMAAVNADPFSLANISDFNGLIARSQEYSVPIFELSDDQLGVQGDPLRIMKQARDNFGELFEKLAESLIQMTALPRA